MSGDRLYCLKKDDIDNTMVELESDELSRVGVLD